LPGKKSDSREGLLPEAGRKVFAWERRLKMGRGYVSLEEDSLTDISDPVLEDFRLHYGREEGLRQYIGYRSQRAGRVLLAGILCLALLGLLLWKQRPVEKEWISVESLELPAYGEGEKEQTLTLVLEESVVAAEEAAAAESANAGASLTFSLVLPELSQGTLEQEKAVQKTLAALAEALENEVLTENLSLPSANGEVSLSYASLTPELMRSDGTLKGGFGSSRQEVQLKIRASLGGLTEETTVTMYLAALSDLPLERRVEVLKEEIENGVYTSDGKVSLPSETQAGDHVMYFVTSGEDDGRISRNAPGLILLCLLMPLAVFFLSGSRKKEAWKERESQIQSRFPYFLEELMILIRTGLPAPACLIRLGQDCGRDERAANPLDEEVRRAGEKLERGYSFDEVMDEWKTRMPLPEVRQLCDLLQQSVRQGDEALLSRLGEMAIEARASHRRALKKRAEEAEDKLLFPLTLMLLAVMLLVLTPALMELT